MGQAKPVLLVVAVSFLAVLGVLAAMERLSAAVAVLYALSSLVTFSAYAIDKSAAKGARWRTPESALLLLGLVGGWPGGLLAQQLLRHKSRKTSFIWAFWLTVAANVLVLLWLLSTGSFDPRR